MVTLSEIIAVKEKELLDCQRVIKKMQKELNITDEEYNQILQEGIKGDE